MLKTDLQTNNSSSIIKLPHLSELDALRTIAVTMTLLAHYWPVEIPYMWYGVPVFFTISGFLITSILLISLEKNKGFHKVNIIKNFMVRRILRLFPIYYIFLVVFWLAKKYLSLYLWKDEFTPYFFTYTPNFIIYQIGKGASGCFAHLWSLGVEEQFYLFWPWLILFTPGSFRIPIIILMILVPFFYVFHFYQDINLKALTFNNFHTLGVGALLACFYVKQGKAILWLKEKRHWLFGITFLHLLAVLYVFRPESPFLNLYREIALCLCTFSIVLVSVFGWKGWMGYFTRSKPVQYIGTISYGIYLYHMPVPYVYRAISAKLFPNFQMSPYVFVMFCFGLTFVLAAISYKYIETPFLRLKSRFG